MQKTLINLPEIKLAGIKTRTNNKDEFDMSKAKISNLITNYFTNNIADKIQNCPKKEQNFSVYSNYENDHNGYYDYLFGKQVTSFAFDLDSLTTLIIPPQTYIKFTTYKGPMPGIVIEAWKKIWQMPDQELGGIRSYIADFEIYDERACDPQNSVVDIYVGIQTKK
jgi:predicted transcriptional regulator YdeE